MAYLGVEGVSSGLIEYLTANLPAQITAVNSEHGDDPVLKAVKTMQDYEHTEMPDTPAIVAVATDAFATGDESSTRLRSEYPFNVILIDKEARDDLIRKRLYRFAEAVVRTILIARNAGGFTLTDGRRVHPYWGEPMLAFTPVYSDEPGQFYQDVSMRLNLSVVDDI